MGCPVLGRERSEIRWTTQKGGLVKTQSAESELIINDVELRLVYTNGRRRDLRRHNSNRVAKAAPVGSRVDGSGTRVTLTSSNDQ